MGKDNVRRACLFHLFEGGLYIGAHKWHKAIAKFLQQKVLQPLGPDKPFRCALRFGPACTDGAKYSPVKPATPLLLDQAKDGAATANFNVIGMTAQEQNL